MHCAVLQRSNFFLSVKTLGAPLSESSIVPSLYLAHKLQITPVGSTGTSSHVTREALHNSWYTGGLIRSRRCTGPLASEDAHLQIILILNPNSDIRFLFGVAFNKWLKPMISLPFTFNEFQPVDKSIG